MCEIENVIQKEVMITTLFQRNKDVPFQLNYSAAYYNEHLC